MADGRYDFIIVGGGSAGCALANRLSADPDNRVLVLEAGRPDWALDVFIHMPAALAFPIGSRFYDWKYESEPEPFMGGRRIYHARGKVLGGLQLDQRDDLPARQPDGLRALGDGPGHGELGLRALPAVLQADGDLPGRGHRRPVARARGAARAGARAGDEPAVRRVLRGGAAGGPAAHRGRQRLPPGGLRGVRPQHPQRQAPVGRARLPPSGARPQEPRGRDVRVRHEDPVRRHARGGGRVPARAAAAPGARPAARSSSAAARSTRRSSCSSRASATRPS